MNFFYVRLERCPLSLVTIIEELLERKSSGSGLETENTAVGDPLHRLRDTPPSAKVGTNFAVKRRLLGRCRLLTEFVFCLSIYTIDMDLYYQVKTFACGFVTQNTTEGIRMEHFSVLHIEFHDNILTKILL
jgi:hypothetical protein